MREDRHREKLELFSWLGLMSLLGAVLVGGVGYSSLLYGLSASSQLVEFFCYGVAVFFELSALALYFNGLFDFYLVWKGLDR